MNPLYLCILILSLLAISECKADKCEDLPAQAQIDVRLEGIAPEAVYRSQVTLNINDQKDVSRNFLKAAASFVFKFEELDQPPRTLTVIATVLDQSGIVLGAGQLNTTFSSNGCNFFTVVVSPGGGPDGAIADAGPPDGPVEDLAEHDAVPSDGPAEDLAEQDSAILDAPSHDAPGPDMMEHDVVQPDTTQADALPPDAGTIIPGTWISIPPQGISMPATYTMGSPTSELCREPGGAKETPHQVTLTRAFEITAHETTQGEFQDVMGYSNSYFPACGSTCPVEKTSWHEAAAYCNALSALTGLTKCYSCTGNGSTVSCSESSTFAGNTVYECPGFRLPTEAEWEYAYRAGSNTAFYPSAGNNGTVTFCNDPDPNADKIGWYKHNAEVTYAGCIDLTSSGGPACAGSHPVGQKAPNAWGLYDMASNVWEWCHDQYQIDLGSSDVTDPVGTSASSNRVMRGGSWSDNPFKMRAANRGDITPSHQGSSLGFRCVRTLPECGDGVTLWGEQCDGSDLGNESCATQGYEGGTISCKGDCTFDTSACYKCGDGIINGPTEICDGPSLGIHTCKTQGFYDGQLKCNPDCTTFDTSECHDCGNGLINPGEQCDGLNFAGKTCQTYAFESGNLTCESDCSAIRLSACSNQGYTFIPRGTFSMGSPSTEPCREPENAKETQHQVTLTHDLEFKTTEVTQGEFQALLGYSPSLFPFCGDTCPVEQVRWHDAVAYCNALSSQKGLPLCFTCTGSGPSVTCQEATGFTAKAIFDCPGYRLPSEAEWEHAYRAGSSTALYPTTGNNGTMAICDSDPNAEKIGWSRFNSAVTYSGCNDLSASGGPSCAGTHPVGQKAPNAWGLFDMAGNVWEWCHDYINYDLGSSAATDPLKYSPGNHRVRRGGSWNYTAQYVRAAQRDEWNPTLSFRDTGFRCVRSLPKVP